MNQTLRQRISELFGYPAMKMSWSLYMAQLNEAGKFTARSVMDILTIILTSMEEQEEKIKDLELLSRQDKPFNDVSPEAKEHILVAEEPKTIEEKISEVTEKTIDKGLVDAILGDKPQEPSI